MSCLLQLQLLRIIYPVQLLLISQNLKWKIQCKHLQSRTYFQDCQQTTQTLARSSHQIVNGVSGFKTRFSSILSKHNLIPFQVLAPSMLKRFWPKRRADMTEHLSKQSGFDDLKKINKSFCVMKLWSPLELRTRGCNTPGYWVYYNR